MAPSGIRGTGLKGVRAKFADALDEIDRSRLAADPPAEEPRAGLDGTKFEPGSWPGAPADRLPPDCPVVPLGVDGKTTFFVDTLGQLIAVGSSEWSKKMLTQLFALRPNYLYWAWPRWSAPKKGHASAINGLEVDDAVQCLLKAAAIRGLFDPNDKVRGRGAWQTSAGLMWHSGDGLFLVDRGKLVSSRPGEVDGTFYPQRPPTLRPWQQPVAPDDGVAWGILEALKTWSWERPQLDPVLALGAIGCMFLGAALPWRPHLFVVGDKAVGKSTLQFIVKSILGDSLQQCADTTAAGVYQRVKQDCLPVAIDELEAGADNRRATAVVNLARLAASGAMMFRGGAEHEGVEFRLQNTFLFSAINPPPLLPQDKSRMAILNLGRLKPNAARTVPAIDGDTGRQILRALMDAWPTFDETLQAWKDALYAGGKLDARAQDTYGTLLTVAELLLGPVDLKHAGFDPDQPEASGRLVAEATASDRAEQSENWRGCLEHMLGSTIEQWRDGQKPIVGKVLGEWEGRYIGDDDTNVRLELIGLRARRERQAADGSWKPIATDDGYLDSDRWMLCVPIGGVGLMRLFAGTAWSGGVWTSALKQAPGEVVVRDRGNGQNVRIARVTQRCLLVDLQAYDRHVEAER